MSSWRHVIIALFAGPVALTAQAPVAEHRVVALAIQGSAPKVDGSLDEIDWSRATPAMGFILREPVEGSPAPEDTEVRFLYTHDALYVGARMRSANPSSIRRLVGRRDGDIPSEQLIVSLDSRTDHRTAYTFAITPGGVRTDYFHPADFEDSRDFSYDPVWEAATALDATGWTAEMRIPFTQLRYNPGGNQVWGVNLERRVPDRNEESFWILVGRNETGWSSRMGHLDGLSDLPRSRRIELSPYVAGNARLGRTVTAADPFNSRYQAEARAGGDLKMGLGPNLTLDATFNPDFGQVEADPAEVNLTAFETFFDERRPFFLEGSDLLGGRGTFYSRRIGAAPPGSATGDYVESADNSTILGAAKVTGRLPSGLSIGALTALTARERVRTFDTLSNSFGSTLVAPLALYGIATARQEVGSNRSIIGASITTVERDVDPGSTLAGIVTRHAYTGLIDGRLRWAGGRYDMSAYLGYSHIAGDSAAILRQQLSSRRYFQRPDARHLRLDPSRTSLGGVTAGINHSKLAGSWRWDIDYSQESPGLELNDIGSLGSADDRELSSNIRYRNTTPGRLFHNWTLGLEQDASWNFDGDRTFLLGGLFGDATFRNFLNAAFDLGFYPRSLSDDQTRGGPLMQTPRAWQLGLEVSSRDGATTTWSLETTGRRDELKGWVLETDAGFGIRAGTRWEASVNARYNRSVPSRQFVTTAAGGGTETFGVRYLFARLERSEIVAQFRLSYAVTPDLTVEGYLEPFASSGRYSQFGELLRPSTFDLRRYGTGGTSIVADGDAAYTVTDGGNQFSFDNPDFDVRSLRSNLVVRWEWQPGSTLFLVWQQNRERNGFPRQDVGFDGLLDSFSIPGDHYLAIKASYWIPIH
ncbi:MAG: DUF5916 domain-containing protein [Gemmatimonadota bacterium]